MPDQHFASSSRQAPELGCGLDIARAYGVASLDENGDWVAGDAGRAGFHKNRRPAEAGLRSHGY